MNIFDQINYISLESILLRVWIQTKRVINTLYLYENWKATDWWKWDVIHWTVTDFSKERAYWDRITFIMRYLNLGKRETVLWFKTNFWLTDETEIKSSSLSTNKPEIMENDKETKIKVQEKWDSLSVLNEEQISYLNDRAIDYTKVDKYIKNNNWYVSCALYDLKWIISIQNRSIVEKRFMIEKWTNSKWVFISDIDKDKKFVYVVEWMFDFLTLAQFTTNVIWLKSSNDWYEVVREFYNKWYKIILIPDNDDAWRFVINKLSDIKVSIFDLSWYEVKDINELLVESKWWEKLLSFIEEERTKEPLNIDWAFSKLEKIKDIYKNNNWRLWQSSPFLNIDKYTQWIIEWKVYTIWWFSNTWKSQFSYEYAQYFLKQWKKVAYFSIEVDTWLLLWYIAKAYYKQKFSDILWWTMEIKKDLFKNLYLYDNINSLDMLSKTIELERPDIVFIDFIQWFECQWNSEYEKMTKLATEIQHLAIKYNIVIFNLSQVNNDSRNKDGWSVTLKGSWALFHSSDVILIIHEDAWSLKLTIAKNKFWKKFKEFDLKIEFETGLISLTESAFNKNNSI